MQEDCLTFRVDARFNVEAANPGLSITDEAHCLITLYEAIPGRLAELYWLISGVEPPVESDARKSS